MLEGAGFRAIPVASAEEALEVVGAGFDIRVMVTDVELSPLGMNGFELVRKVNEVRQIGIVVVSGRAAPDGGELPPNARFVAKPVHEATLIHLVRDVEGSKPKPLPIRADVSAEPAADWTLTPRQHQVLDLLVQGKSNREIAEALRLSENTVKVHLVTIYRALGVSSRTEALLSGIKRMTVNPQRSFGSTGDPPLAREV
jgi:DNA-binding NarL/FixJ family response regulator